MVVFFSCDLWSMYPTVHFLSTWLSSTNAITNSNGDSVSPWKIPLRIFTSVKFFPLTFSLTLPFWMVFSINFTISCTFWYSLLSIFVGPYHMPSFSLSTPLLGFSVSFCFPYGCVDQYILLFCIFDPLEASFLFLGEESVAY